MTGRCRLVRGFGEFEKIEPSLGREGDTASSGERDYFVHYYSFAIPNDEALSAITECSPVVEVGAGGGYWASLLIEHGCDVLAYDHERAGASDWSMKAWSDVKVGNEFSATGHADRTLMLCWPPGSDLFAEWTLEAYEGNKVIYIGEHAGGCCATSGFFALLNRDFELKREVDIPRFLGLNDYLSIWSRR